MCFHKPRTFLKASDILEYEVTTQKKALKVNKYLNHKNFLTYHLFNTFNCVTKSPSSKIRSHKQTKKE